jgi:hypothetical protein
MYSDTDMDDLDVLAILDCQDDLVCIGDSPGQLDLRAPTRQDVNMFDSPRSICILPDDFYTPDVANPCAISPDDIPPPSDLRTIPDFPDHVSPPRHIPGSPTIALDHTQDTQGFDIPDLSPSPVERPTQAGFDIPDLSPSPVERPMQAGFDIPDLSPSPVECPMQAGFDIPDLSPSPVERPMQAGFDIPDLSPRPQDDLMEMCKLSPFPLTIPDLHEISNARPEPGPSRVEPQLDHECAAERSLKTLKKNLLPHLPILLSRTSLLRAELTQLILEKEMTTCYLDGAVTKILEMDRYLNGLRALQRIREERVRDEEAGV